MYIPKYFKVTNVDEIWDFVQKNSFGTIVPQNEGNQLPLICPWG
ncbi:putative FMN-binding regulatory protein PaiB [Bacillus pakistanensis]|uniref:FMN-binding regulatory protein PaiB n=1 Tax=Rossellomorea pakistanensis TaxID=992288 RepID=A0ABS2NJZ0_9BACI|nr:putative FMN-binding regulatory protein PaiB [Bacillus pakistanensis]